MSRRVVALLRGINVGGRNRVTMLELREAVLSAGFEEVSTYIQSGNLLLTVPAGRGDAWVEGELERAVSPFVDGDAVVMVRSGDALKRIVEEAPTGFGSDTYRSDAVFVKAPLTVPGLIAVLDLREGVDQAWPGDGVVYFARLASALSRSRLSRLVARPEYQLVTVRSWRTVTRLAERLTGEAS
jgi:uncharacterized protein (DUF1697 family)